MSRSPVNYLLNTPNTFDTILKGYQLGKSLSEVNEKKMRAKEMQQELAQLSQLQNISVEDLNKLSIKYPEMQESFKFYYNQLNEEQQKQQLSDLSKVYASLENNSPELAKELLETQKQAHLNSGDQKEAGKIDAMLKIMEVNPNAAKMSARLALSSILGPEKFADSFAKLTETSGNKIGTYKFDPKAGMINTKTGEVLTSVKELGLPTNDPEKQFDQEDKLRKDFNSVTTDFRQVRDAIARVNAAGENPSPAGDLALIFNYMKILDPRSTVREGEFANAENSGSVEARVWKTYNKIINGERLAPEQRQDFLNRAQKLYEERQNQYNKTSNEYRKLADRYNLNPDNVVLDFQMVEKVPNFNSIEELKNAKLPVGTIITINGRRAEVY